MTQQKITVHQTTEWGRLRALFRGSLEALILPPLTQNTATVYSAIPGLVEILERASQSGERVHLKDVLPEHYDDLAKTHEELDAVFRKFDIATYTIKHSPSIENYYGFTKAGYWGATPESCLKVIGNVMLEMGLNDTVLACGPNAFGYHDYIREFLSQDKNMHWLALPPALPMGADEGQGPGPWTTGADMKLIEDKTIVVGIGVHEASEVNDLTKERSATNELAVELLNRMFSPYGWKSETYYYKTIYGHHANFVMSVLRPGLAVVAANAVIGELPPSMKDYELIEVSEEESFAGGVNVLPIDAKNAVTCEAAPRMNEALSNRGIEVHPVDASGAVRYGAGPQCNVIAIQRDDASRSTSGFPAGQSVWKG